MNGINVAAFILAMLLASSLVDASKLGLGVREAPQSLSMGGSRPPMTLASASASAFCRRGLGSRTRKKMMENKLIFSSSNTSRDNNIAESLDAIPSISSLMKKAKQVRQKLYCNDDAIQSLPLPSFLNDPSKQLCYPSSTYNMIIDNGSPARASKKKIISVRRGYCNWLLPNKIMIGSYPGMTPEINGPTRQESLRHIQNMVQSAKITLFCCLQSEVPCQMDGVAWRKTKQFEGGSESEDGDDVIYLEPDYLRREFPRPFTRYGPLAQAFASDSSSSLSKQLEFLHSPIEDLGVPDCNTSLLSLLSKLLQHLHINDDLSSTTHNPVIYLHCWGGRGRAGLVGACLASLLFPELSSKSILDWIQCGYDSRCGAESMADGLKRSPQTKEQRLFVKEFVALVHVEKENTDR